MSGLGKNNGIPRPLSPVEGDLLAWVAGRWVSFPAGTSGYAIVSNGPGVAPSYQAVGITDPGLVSLMSADGGAGIPYTSAANTWVRLALAADKALYASGTSTLNTYDISSFWRGISNSANQGAARSALGVAIGSDVMAYDADLAAIAALTTASYGRSLLELADAAAGRTLLGLGTVSTLASDTDGTLAANSDSRVATQKAVKTYVDTAVTGLLDFKGSTDASSNPNYPAASKGDAYVVSVAGKIGGASGASVDVGDVYVASADNAGGTQAGVGTSWFVMEHNLAGALLAANNLSDVSSAATARSNLGLAIGSQVAAYDAGVASLTAADAGAGLVYTSGADTWTRLALSADVGIYATGAGALSTFSLPAASRALLALTAAADKIGYFTGASTAALADFTSFGRSLVAAASAYAARVVLETDHAAKGIDGYGWRARGSATRSFAPFGNATGLTTNFGGGTTTTQTRGRGLYHRPLSTAAPADNTLVGGWSGAAADAQSIVASSAMTWTVYLFFGTTTTTTIKGAIGVANNNAGNTVGMATNSLGIRYRPEAGDSYFMGFSTDNSTATTTSSLGVAPGATTLYVGRITWTGTAATMAIATVDETTGAWGAFSSPVTISTNLPSTTVGLCPVSNWYVNGTPGVAQSIDLGGAAVYPGIS